MRALIAVLGALSIAAGAQTTDNRQPSPSSCGNEKVRFTAEKSGQHPSPSPRDGQAAVYIFSKLNYGGILVGCQVVSRIAIDGNWVGANCATSYLVANVPPGEHHLCADWQPSYQTKAPFGDRPLPALASFFSEAGKTYYYLARVTYEKGISDIALEPVDPDEGKQLITATFASESRRKK